MSDAKLGRTLDGDEKRDAIHLAIAPVVAGETLLAGQNVGIGDDGKAYQMSKSVVSIGIVDPFLRREVRKDERFYLCLYPGTINGMRHHWSHPNFADEVSHSPNPDPSAEKAEARQWIIHFADRVGLTYDELMEGAAEWIRTCGGEWLCRGGLLEGEIVPDEFWTHYETLTGQKGEGSFFTCSC